MTSHFKRGYQVFKPPGRRDQAPISSPTGVRGVRILPDISLGSVLEAVITHAPYALPSIRLMTSDGVESAGDLDDFPVSIRKHFAGIQTGTSLHRSHYVSPAFRQLDELTGTQWALRIDDVADPHSRASYGSRVWATSPLNRHTALQQVQSMASRHAGDQQPADEPVCCGLRSCFDLNDWGLPSSLALKFSYVDATQNPPTTATARAVVLRQLEQASPGLIGTNTIAPFYCATSPEWRSYGHSARFHLAIEGSSIEPSGKRGETDRWLRSAGIQSLIDVEEAELDKGIGNATLPITISADIAHGRYSGRVRMVLSSFEPATTIQSGSEPDKQAN